MRRGVPPAVDCHSGQLVPLPAKPNLKGLRRATEDVIPPALLLTSGGMNGVFPLPHARGGDTPLPPPPLPLTPGASNALLVSHEGEGRAPWSSARLKVAGFAVNTGNVRVNNFMIIYVFIPFLPIQCITPHMRPISTHPSTRSASATVTPTTAVHPLQNSYPDAPRRIRDVIFQLSAWMHAR